MASNTELKRGSADLMMLASLEERERHGYEIAELIDDRSGGQAPVPRRSIRCSCRMERRDWIEGKWIEKAGQRRRRYSRLTAVGRKVLLAQRSDWHALLTAFRRVGGFDPVS